MAEPTSNPAVARDPDWGEPRLRKRFAAFMYGFAAVVCAAVQVLPDPDPSDRSALVSFAVALSLAFVAVVVLPASRVLALWSNRFAVLFVSGIVLVAHPLGAVPYFYVWPMLFAALVLPRRELWVAAVLTVVTFAIALALNPSEGSTILLVSASASSIGVAAVVRATRSQRDALEHDLRRAAATDALTDLPNRRAFDEALERVSGAATPERPMALVMLDVDRFKRINDQHGHAVGDASLRVVAAALRGAAPDAVAARIGGEEFALVMAAADERAARRAVDAVDRALMELDPSLPPTVQLSTSAGIVTSTGGIGREALLHVADEALYRAKAEGRGRAVVGRAAADAAASPGEPLDATSTEAARPAPTGRPARGSDVLQSTTVREHVPARRTPEPTPHPSLARR